MVLEATAKLTLGGMLISVCVGVGDGGCGGGGN